MVVQDGELKGATLTGLMRDFSQGGMGITFDGGNFERGTAVKLECEGGLLLSAWVCHTSVEVGSSRVGLSFVPVDRLQPSQCFDRVLCESDS